MMNIKVAKDRKISRTWSMLDEIESKSMDKDEKGDW